MLLSQNNFVQKELTSWDQKLLQTTLAWKYQRSKSDYKGLLVLLCEYDGCCLSSCIDTADEWTINAWFNYPYSAPFWSKMHILHRILHTIILAHHWNISTTTMKCLQTFIVPRGCVDALTSPLAPPWRLTCVVLRKISRQILDRLDCHDIYMYCDPSGHHFNLSKYLEN